MSGLVGYVKIFRKLQTWGWRKSPKHLSVFIDLLLEANHIDRVHLGILVPKGSLSTSLAAIANRTGLSVQNVRTVLKDLNSTQETTSKPCRYFTLISITNWPEYQVPNMEANNEVTSKQQRSNIEVTTNKNVKNVKNGEKDKKLNLVSPSPLSVLFEGNEEVQAWLSTGNQKTHQGLLETFQDDYLCQAILNAFEHQKEKRKNYLAGTFLTGWINRDFNKIYRPGMSPADLKLRKFFADHGIVPDRLIS